MSETEPPNSRPSRVPFFGTISLAMAGLALVAILERNLLHFTDAWFLATLIGLICGLLGRRRKEQPTSLSTIGLVANAVIPTAWFVLILLAGVALGGWLKPQ